MISMNENPTPPNQINDIKFAEYNPRVMSAHDAAALEKSMTEFGDLSCMISNRRTLTWIGGHQRARTLFKKFSDRVVIDVRETFAEPDQFGTVATGFVSISGTQLKFAYRQVDWPLEREKSANIAANRIQGDFNDDMLAELTYELSQLEDTSLLDLTGLTNQEVNKLLDASGANGEEEDDVPEVDESTPAVSQLGEIYQLGPHRLMCGDSTDFGQLTDLMAGETANLVFTDPPYGVSYQSNMRTATEKFDVIENDDVLITEWIEPVMQVSNGFMFIWTSWKVLGEWLEITKKIGPMTNMIIWDKGGGGIGDLQGTYASDFEVALVFNRGAKLTGERIGSVWGIGKDAPSLYEHPTQKPSALALEAIKTTTLRGDKVLDVFGGSGSTLLACEKSNRICYVMELDPKYCDVIRKRYAKHVGQEEAWVDATPVIQKPTGDAIETPTVAT